MDELTIKNDYKAYKKALDVELKTNVESFVRIGYLLKVARDTEVLRDSGYRNVADFAKAEYGLTKDVVSRYIAINDKYSEGGYSDKLQLQFENYGVAKLSEMLTLPDSIIEEIEPTLTRKEIQDIKKEVIDEEKITPLEVYMEGLEEKSIKEEKEYTFTQRVWIEYLRSENRMFEKIEKAVDFKPFPEDKDIETLYDILAPSGEAAIFARVPGTGKIMIHLKGVVLPVTMTPVRGGEKITCSVKDIYYDLAEIENVLNSETEEKKNKEVVPVQPEEQKQDKEEFIMPEPISDEIPFVNPAEEAKAELTEEKAAELVEEMEETAVAEAEKPAEKEAEDATKVTAKTEAEEATEEEAAEPVEVTAETEAEKPVEEEAAEPTEVTEVTAETEAEEPTEEKAAEPVEVTAKTEAEEPTEEEAAEPAEEPVDMSACMFRIFDAASCIKDIASTNINKDAYLMSDIDRIISKAQCVIDNATKLKEA